MNNIININKIIKRIKEINIITIRVQTDINLTQKLIITI
jgi:hypothetical protein